MAATKMNIYDMVVIYEQNKQTVRFLARCSERFGMTYRLLSKDTYLFFDVAMSKIGQLTDLINNPSLFPNGLIYPPVHPEPYCSTSERIVHEIVAYRKTDYDRRVVVWSGSCMVNLNDRSLVKADQTGRISQHDQAFEDKLLLKLAGLVERYGACVGERYDVKLETRIFTTGQAIYDVFSIGVVDADACMVAIGDFYDVGFSEESAVCKFLMSVCIKSIKETVLYISYLHSVLANIYAICVMNSTPIGTADERRDFYDKELLKCIEKRTAF